MSDPADLFAPPAVELEPAETEVLDPAPPGARCGQCAQFVQTMTTEWGVCVPAGYRRPGHRACPLWEPGA